MKIIPSFPLELLTAFFKIARKINVKRFGSLLYEACLKNNMIASERNAQNLNPRKSGINRYAECFKTMLYEA